MHEVPTRGDQLRANGRIRIHPIKIPGGIYPAYFLKHVLIHSSTTTLLYGVFYMQGNHLLQKWPYTVDADHTGLKHHGRFLRPRRFTTRRTICPFAPAYNATVDSPVCTGLPRRGRFTRERLQLHLAIINFMADYFRPGTSGDIHLKYILFVHIFCQRTIYLCLGLQYC